MWHRHRLTAVHPLNLSMEPNYERTCQHTLFVTSVWWFQFQHGFPCKKLPQKIASVSLPPRTPRVLWRYRAWFADCSVRSSVCVPEHHRCTEWLTSNVSLHAAWRMQTCFISTDERMPAQLGTKAYGRCDCRNLWSVQSSDGTLAQVSRKHMPAWIRTQLPTQSFQSASGVLPGWGIVATAHSRNLYLRLYPASTISDWVHLSCSFVWQLP